MKYIYYILFTLQLVAGLYSCKDASDNVVDNLDLSSLKISARNIAMTIHTTYNQRSGVDENLNQKIEIDTKSENMTVEKIDGEITFSRYQYPNISTVKLFFQAGNQLTINLYYYYTMTYNDEVTEYYQWNGTFFNIPYKIDQDSISIFLKGKDFRSRTSGLYYFYQLNIFKPGHYSGTTEKYSKNYNITDDS